MPGRVLHCAGIPHENVIEEQSRFAAAHESADDFGQPAVRTKLYIQGMDGNRCRLEKPPPRIVVQRSFVSAISPSMFASTEAATSLSTAPRIHTAPSRSNCAMTSSEINCSFIGFVPIKHLQRKYLHNCRTGRRCQGRLFEQQKTHNARQFPGLLRHVRHVGPDGHHLRGDVRAFRPARNRDHGQIWLANLRYSHRRRYRTVHF